MTSMGIIALSVLLYSTQTGSSLEHCYDARVTARVLSQIPTVMEMTSTDESGNFLIIHSWPWILDLNVRAIHEGSAQTGWIRVLNIQHTDYRPRRMEFLLRRNDQGGYNVVRASEGERLALCDGGTVDRAYLTPAEGRTLDDYRNEGARHYGRD